MRLSTSWHSLTNATGSLREQSRREPDGRKHRETAAINSEIAGDNPKPRIKHGRSVDSKRINAERFRVKMVRIHDSIREQFGPRLVRSDGSALYTFQVKR